MTTDPAAAAVAELFRRESGRITAWLLRRYGAGRYAMVEDAVQDALVAALRAWRIGGVPVEASAWLHASARNAMVDRLRRAARIERHASALRLGEVVAVVPDDTVPGQAEPLADDLLMLLFVCAHPALEASTRITLMARSVCGFTVAEIASAFHDKPAAVAQRLVRAKAKLTAIDARFEWPEGVALSERRDSVLAAIHLMFTTGHRPIGGDQLVDATLCAEALRLAELVAADARTRSPEAHALAALIALHHARHSARLTRDGMAVSLADQDRMLWDRSVLARGFLHLERAIGGERLSRWHLEAEIAALHAAAPSIEATDWHAIVRAYDDLLALTKSPAVRLNRAIALAWRAGARAGLAELKGLAADWRSGDRGPLDAAFAELHEQLGEREAAEAFWARALEAATNAAERRYLARRLAAARSVAVATGST
ncbi:MAG: hypothetical protein FJX57_08530 [Alphaproteobacteria bacterium]|nr:hypothetical protein [Alphaproteobacteria bacterium]